MNKVPIQAFISTKEHSPRDSQDDKILSQTLQNYPKFQNICWKVKEKSIKTCNHLGKRIMSVCILYVV